MLVATRPLRAWVDPRHPPSPMLNKSKRSRRHTSNRASVGSSLELHSGAGERRSRPGLGSSGLHEQNEGLEGASLKSPDQADPPPNAFSVSDGRPLSSPRFSSEGDRASHSQFLDHRERQQQRQQLLLQHVPSTRSSPASQHTLSSQRVIQPNIPLSAASSNSQSRANRPLRRRPTQQVLSACSNCKKDHLSCDASRPCNRCVSTNKQVTSARSDRPLSVV